mgnify:CR=1 FL=1
MKLMPIVTNKKTFLITLLLSFLLLVNLFAFARDQTPSAEQAPQESSCVCDKDCEPGGLMKEVSKDCACCGCCQLIDILKIVRGVANLILRWVGVIALAFFIVGGIIWLTSAGDPEKVKKGKQILVGSLIGTAIVFLAWTIVNTTICVLSKGEIKPACEIFGQPWYKALK